MSAIEGRPNGRTHNMISLSCAMGFIISAQPLAAMATHGHHWIAAV